MYKMALTGNILLFSAVAGFCPTLGVIVTSFPSIQSTCRYSTAGQCADDIYSHDIYNLTVCYDGQLFSTMCELFTASCTGFLRENVTRAIYNSSCEVIVVVKPEQTTLPSFLDRMYNDAVHGVDDLLRHAYGKFGKTFNEMKQIFSLQDHVHKLYRRNVDCWAFPLDLTSISPWNSQGENRKGGVLITRRHALWAKHYSMHVNTTLRFVDSNNNVVDRQIVKTKAVPTNGHVFLRGYDIVIGELDREVPATISHSKVLPKSVTKIEPLPNGTHIPVINTDFEEKALVSNIYFNGGRMAWLSLPSQFSFRSPFYEEKIIGDSGSPVFLVLNNELVLLFVLTFGGPGSGTSVTYHYDDINAILKEWGTGYQLTEVNLVRYMT